MASSTIAGEISVNNTSECGSISVTLNGSSISGSDQILVGQTLRVTATPTDEWIVSYWTVNDEAIDTSRDGDIYYLELTTVSNDISITPMYIKKESYSDVEDLSSIYFDFDLEHPVTMLAERSFDGSVNLVLTDNKNEPKLINTGFHVQDNESYELIERIGINNTNRYNLGDETAFALQTSLYRYSDKIPTFVFDGFSEGGQLKVGTYCFYVVSCDKDGNESDILGESGIISVFKGTDGDPFSVEGGVLDESTDKAVKLTIQDLDDCYNYIKIYYTRTTAGNNQTSTTLAYKITEKYATYKSLCELLITGYETTEKISLDALNTQYFNADLAKAEAVSLNILFLGNVVEKNMTSEEDALLKDLSLRIIPTYDISVGINLKSDYTYEQ